MEANPYDIESHLFLSDILIRSMEYGEALDVLGAIIRFEPENLLLRMKRAALFTEMQEFDDAISDYKVALELPRADQDYIRDSLGRVEQKAGRLDNAVEWWSEISDRAKAANKLWASRRLDKAEECLREAIRQNPFKSSNYENLAELWLSIRIST